MRLLGQDGSDHLVRLINLRDQQEEIVVYLKGSQSLDIQIPAGTYEVRLASGRAWLGLDQRFGSSTRYAKLSAPVVLSRPKAGAKGPQVLNLSTSPDKASNQRMSRIERSQF